MLGLEVCVNWTMIFYKDTCKCIFCYGAPACLNVFLFFQANKWWMMMMMMMIMMTVSVSRQYWPCVSTFTRDPFDAMDKLLPSMSQFYLIIIITSTEQLYSPWEVAYNNTIVLLISYTVVALQPNYVPHSSFHHLTIAVQYFTVHQWRPLRHRRKFSTRQQELYLICDQETMWLPLFGNYTGFQSLSGSSTNSA